MGYTKGMDKQQKDSCKHCNREFPGGVGLAQHIWRCPQNPECSYTKSHINTQIRKGFINPHDRDSCHAYINQVYGQPSITDRAHQASMSNTEDGDDVDFGCTHNNDPFEQSMEDTNTNQDDNDDAQNNYIVDSQLPLMYANNLLRQAELKNKVPSYNHTKCKNTIYDNHLPVNITCWAHLLYIVNENGGSTKLFNSIVKFITKWTQKYPKIFKCDGMSTVYSRRSLIDTLEKAFRTKCLKPKDVDVILPSNGRKVTVPVPDFASLTRFQLSKDYILDNISPNIDRDTFRPIISVEEHENNPKAVIGEKDTGWMYREAIKSHCPDVPDPTLVRPYPLCLHTDYSHADTNGFLKGCPVQCFPAMLTNKAQSDSKCWMLMSLIPSLSTGKGKKKNKKNGLLNSRDYHAVLSAALSSLKKYMDAGGFYWIDPMGRTVLLKPYVLINLGDSAGHNENVAKKQHSKHMVRECRCTFKQLIQFPPACQPLKYDDISSVQSSRELFDLARRNRLISMEDLSHAYDNQKYADTISYYSKVDVGWNNLLLSDPYFGIVGISPYDIIHSIQGGMQKYKTQAHKNIIGPGETNASLKSDIELMMHDIKFLLGRNAERDIMPMSTRSGYFSCTNLSCEEVEGNNFGYMILLHTTFGQKKLKDCYEALGMNFDDALETYKLLFSWERFYMDSNQRDVIEESSYATLRLMKRIMVHLPREVRKRVGSTPGSHGWHIVKFHAMWMMAYYVLKFGSARGFDTSNNEKNHKVLFKQHKDRTQKQSGKFVKQVAHNEHIRLTVNLAHEQMKCHYPSDISDLGEKIITKSKSEHKYTEYLEEISDSDVSDESSDSYESDDSDQSMGEPSVEKRLKDANRVDNIYYEGRISTIKNIRGRFDLKITIDHRGRRNVTRNWNWEEKNRAGQLTNPLVETAIADFHMKYCHLYDEPSDGEIEVRCFTSARINDVLYHFDEDFNGSPWYDWVNAHFPETADCENYFDCAACIMGMFQYKTKHAPTYDRVEMQNLDWESIENSELPDPKTYMVLHCSEDKLNFKDIRSKFIYPFTMTALADIYILPIEMINGPIAVIPDLIRPNAISTKNFLAILPRSQQGSYFRRYIKSEDVEYEVDMNEQSRFDSDSEGSDYEDYESESEETSIGDCDSEEFSVLEEDDNADYQLI